MSIFDDANVDKDLLSQIFADEGDGNAEDNAETEALLNELLKDDGNGGKDDMFAGLGQDDKADSAEAETPAEEPPAAVSEEPAVSEPVAEASVSEPVEEVPISEEPVIEPVEEAAEPAVEEVKEEKIEEIKEEPVVENNEAVTESANEEKEQIGIKFEQNSDKDPVRQEANEKMESERAKGMITTITSGTTIRGGISSEGSLEVMGVISGDVECQGKVAIIGQVTGNIIASEIYVSTDKRLEGGLSSEGSIKIGVGTVVVGDVDGTSAYIAGAVKGNIDVNGHVEVDSTAIICGDIKAKSIQVNSGAVVEGNMSLNYAGVDLNSFFEDN